MNWNELITGRDTALKCVWNLCFCDILGKRKSKIFNLHGVFFSEVSIDSHFISQFTVHYHIFPFNESLPTFLRKQGMPRPLRDTAVSTLCYMNADFQEWNRTLLPLHLPVDGRWLSEIGNVPKDTIDYYPKIDGGNSIYFYCTLLSLSIFY